MESQSQLWIVSLFLLFKIIKINLRFNFNQMEECTLADLGNDHEFINKESPKQNHESLCSKWTISYHCGESCSSNNYNI